MRTPTPPGSTILDLINQMAINQSDLARALKRPIKTINEIIHGKARITPETALQLEKFFNVEAEFWVVREAHYRLGLARLKKTKARRHSRG